MLFQLTDGDLSKTEEVKNCDAMLAYDFLYQKRVKNLNQKIYDLESILNAKKIPTTG